MRITIQGKSFGARKVLGNFQLELADMQATALLGPSGIGKTTLLRILAGLEADDTGVAAKSGRIGMVFQEPRLLPWLTAGENLSLVADPADWLDRVGLGGFEHHYPRQLSLGMARRVALARALAIEPELLILDEPFASLDTATAEEMKRLIASILKIKPVTTILVTHDVDDAKAMTTHTAILSGSPAVANIKH